MATVVVVLGVVLTLAVSWTAWLLNHNNSDRLLQVETRQAGDVLSSTILEIRNPLITSLQIAEATGGEVSQFDKFMTGFVGPDKLFASAALWRLDGGVARQVTSLGDSPLLDPDSAQASSFVTGAFHRNTFLVRQVRMGDTERIGYVIADPRDPVFAIYVERAIPANRVVPVEKSSAFTNLNYATYIGAPTPSNLATTDVPVSDLPFTGSVAVDAVPFGNTTLTLVAVPRVTLGGSLGQALPWVFLVGGALLTLAAAGVAAQLTRRRRTAEADAATITSLFGRLDGLYAEQRSIAETLQRALLPQSNPDIPELEIATRYEAGADGVDVGGDWYSLIPLDDRHFAFAIGDVSGRGVSAATIMARMRFTIRAYLVEGHPPDVVLQMCSQQLSISRDGHLSTALVGIGDLETHELTVANAGHLNPLVVRGTDAEYLETAVGLPLGVTAASYKSSSTVIPPGSTVVAFTDGLVERRGEVIDDGLARLAEAAGGAHGSLDELLATVVSQLAQPDASDDVAALAFRWRVAE